MSSFYSDVIRRWAADTRRAGVLADADGIGEIGLEAGRVGTRLAVRFALRVRDGRAEMVRYQVFGCGFTFAACAAAAEMAEGLLLQEVAAIPPKAVDDALAGLPSERSYCAGLAVQALRAAVQSVRSGLGTLAGTVTAEDDHSPLVTAADPVYRLLVNSQPPAGADPEDRQLFACLLAAMAGEASGPAGFGLTEEERDELLRFFFPAVSIESLPLFQAPAAPVPFSADQDILPLLLDYMPRDAAGCAPKPSNWLVCAIAARASREGHLWRAMGLFARAELTSAIRRLLPALYAANSKGMRWKRFLFKQLCEARGGIMCRSPECGLCSERAFCFAEEV